MNLDGTGLRQLTDSDYDDIDPIYLPDGHIMFTTTRGNTYVRCGPYIYSYVLARCDADGRNVYLISMNSEPDFVPALLNDGRVVYSRWEYSDKDQNRVQSLWTTLQDGTQTAVLWGNQSVWPDHLAEPRPMPGSGRVMFTVGGTPRLVSWVHRHHRSEPRDSTSRTGSPGSPLTCPGRRSAILPLDRSESPHYHASGRYTGYLAPYPLSEEDFLVSARGEADKFRIYLMDVHGNRELIYEGAAPRLVRHPGQTASGAAPAAGPGDLARHRHRIASRRSRACSTAATFARACRTCRGGWSSTCGYSSKTPRPIPPGRRSSPSPARRSPPSSRRRSSGSSPRCRSNRMARFTSRRRRGRPCSFNCWMSTSGRCTRCVRSPACSRANAAGAWAATACTAPRRRTRRDWRCDARPPR